MKVHLVRIGNARGIRIPRPLIDQCGFGDTVDLQVDKNRLVVSPDKMPRQGWAEAFQAAGDSCDDELLLDSLPPNQFDREEWKW